MVEDCVFCRIVQGEISSDKVYEDNDFIVILDINPYARGHVLIIPKNHSRWIWDMDDREYSRYMFVVKKVALVLRKVFETEYVQEIIAGVDVEHSHVHLLPRVEEDGFYGVLHEPMKEKLDENEMREIFEKIRDGFIK